MRVLHLVKTAVGATWALRQMRELVRLGVEVHVALPPGGPLADMYRAAGVCVHQAQIDFPVRMPHRFPATVRLLQSLVAEVRPDLIHSHFVGTTVSMRLALGIRSSIPRVFQVPGPLHLEHQFLRRAELLTAGPLDYWIGSCQWTCQRYRMSGVPTDHVFLSYYGVDVDKFRRRPRGKLHQEIHLGTNQKIVGMVAYMYAPKRFLGQSRGLKGHEDLIDAMRLYLDVDSNVTLVIIGGAWGNAHAYEDYLHHYAWRQLGDRVVFLGTRSDVPEIYPDLDVVVHPSHSENVGGAVESLLSEVPTIATNVGGFPDLVIDGETGWLVPAKQPASIAAALCKVFGRPNDTRLMIEKGAARARKLFNVETTAREVADIYQTVLSRLP